MSTIQLIKLYCTVCEQYSTTLCYEVQRLSNNFRPQFTDEEVITVYLWGIFNGHYEQRAIYDFIIFYFLEWFPRLPSYTNFSRRLNNLAPCFMRLAESLITYGSALYGEFIPHQVIDSLPIMVANQARSGTAKVAPNLCSKGYCSTKKQYYYGSKLHLRACLRPGSIPFPCQISLSQASEHDLTAAKQMLQNQGGFTLYGDKAFRDKEWGAELLQYNQITVVTPPKKAKGQKELPLFDNALSTVISSIRQPIESIFNWFIAKTHIQNAEKVRSSNGLILHAFGKVTACLLLMLVF